FFFQAEDGIRDVHVTGVQTCALPIYALERDVVLAEPGVLGPGQARRLLRLECIEIGFGLGVQLFARHGTTCSTIFPMCSPASMRSEERRVGNEGRRGVWVGRAETREG